MGTEQQQAEQKSSTSPGTGSSTPPLNKTSGTWMPEEVRSQVPKVRRARVYVASSWRNEERQQSMVRILRAQGYEVYDFRNPAPGARGFSWSEVDAEWGTWLPHEFVRGLSHPAALKGFTRDMEALRGCDACVLVQPCGRSAHLELGWAAGAGKVTVVLLAVGQEAELMLNMADVLALDERQVLQALSDAGLEAGVLE